MGALYRYDEFDAAFVQARVAEFRDQVARRLSGEITEDEFKSLRLMNGVYLQLHAYMLRIAIPYGTLSSRQLRQLAMIGRRWDRNYGHFTTRQNLQFNWVALKDVPDVLEALAEVEMHAIQTSGNCMRNVTADHFAGAAADEIADPRVYAEIMRQWSTAHPELSYLPRKFKVAITGAPQDRAAIQVHDIGYQIVRNDAGELGFRVFVGGGQGRTPMIGKAVRDFLPEADLLTYTEAIMRVYNLEGRRDNKYKARIKILVHEKGFEAIQSEIEAEFAAIRDGALKLTRESVEDMKRYFIAGPFDTVASSPVFDAAKASDPAFAAWAAVNVTAHKVPGYGIATISLKPIGGIPGDATSEQMELVADLADRYSLGEIRVSHLQNLILPHVRLDDLPALHAALASAGLGTANEGLVTDIIACPGLDYCSLANARAIPIAQRLSERFGAPERQAEIGHLPIKISGCINACGHHHVGAIGILGVDRKGVENYQITLGGSAREDCSIGALVGPGFSYDGIVDAVETVVDTYLGLRQSREETFLEAVRRVGLAPFKEALYGQRA
ncbi:nitrite/sulfite reductase [Labrys wisconsinensis]|uniref:Sulfite reductase (NADPH) hemoprotein beta-component n=1 Tax=Labrys wisconsinensis TaxID=425677 RepID=A0ABU0J403_9HYPH|nr:nitrite/sulfite reductase [Labrys wisconsinensis]MDQ0469002.1 sulfite reductase (NADPH) hemoprotein beta-component [Labrys wisconsinensis]